MAGYDRALALEPDLAVAWLARGMLQAQRGEAGAARRDLERFLELAPGAPQARIARERLAELGPAR